ncbi:MAG TPA: alpha/beta fold hydrolase [Verrucomicrobiae bacterium]|jgi:homoserine O-acetyltransferase|nr:alpha/beta fold hydrolase [Verrucomicrobiae bacterium]
MKTKTILLLLTLTLSAAIVPAADYPAPAEGDLVIHNFRFESGQTLPELRLHYRTLGSPRRDSKGIVRNAVLILHGTTGSGAQFIRPEFAGELFGKGQPLDASQYFLILPDGIGHGKSSKPSDGLRALFPNYGYRDMVEAQYRLVTDGLKVNHLRLIMGTSMGGMHTWLWGEIHPGFMDALVPLASLPTQISGRNRVWRRMIIDSIRGAPDWQDGNYTAQPYGLRLAAEMLYFMGENPALRLREAPTIRKADTVLNNYVARFCADSDANDVLYALEASGDYDPGPGLEKITAPLLAINSADDLINPPDQGVLEREIRRVRHGRAIVIPESDQTVGHGSHTKAVLWEKAFVRFLNKTESQKDQSK